MRSMSVLVIVCAKIVDIWPIRWKWWHLAASIKGVTNVSLNMKDILNSIISISDIDTQLSIVEMVEEINCSEEKLLE